MFTLCKTKISIRAKTEHKNKPESHGVLMPNYSLKAVMSESVKLVLRDLVLITRIPFYL